MKRMASTYRLDVTLTVAAVPYDSPATSGRIAPEPRTSHALSAAAAMTGSPAGNPVASAALGPTSPSRPVGGISSGSHAGSTGATVQLQWPGAAHRMAR